MRTACFIPSPSSPLSWAVHDQAAALPCQGKVLTRCDLCLLWLSSGGRVVSMAPGSVGEQAALLTGRKGACISSIVTRAHDCWMAFVSGTMDNLCTGTVWWWVEPSFVFVVLGSAGGCLIVSAGKPHQQCTAGLSFAVTQWFG